MSDFDDGRKISIKKENAAFLKKLQSEGLIKDTGNGVLIGFSYALKHKLNHVSLDAPRSADFYGNIDDGKSFNFINEAKTVLDAIYPKKYNDIEAIKSPIKLIRVLADAGLDEIREKCKDENIPLTKKFLEAIEI
jgi:hypothetical protein